MSSARRRTTTRRGARHRRRRRCSARETARGRRRRRRATGDAASRSASSTTTRPGTARRSTAAGARRRATAVHDHPDAAVVSAWAARATRRAADRGRRLGLPTERYATSSTRRPSVPPAAGSAPGTVVLAGVVLTAASRSARTSSRCRTCCSPTTTSSATSRRSAPASRSAGGVHVGTGAYIGAGALVREYVRVGAGASSAWARSCCTTSPRARCGPEARRAGFAHSERSGGRSSHRAMQMVTTDPLRRPATAAPVHPPRSPTRCSRVVAQVLPASHRRPDVDGRSSTSSPRLRRRPLRRRRATAPTRCD